MFEDVDWTHGEGHMWEKHGVTVAEANEALRDPMRVLIDPDYNSKTGQSARIIGWSDTYGDLLSIIVVTEDGDEYGANGWRSNEKDRRLYESITGEE